MSLVLLLYCRELRKVADKGKPGGVLRPGRSELLQLAYHNSLPFIGVFSVDPVHQEVVKGRVGI